MKNEPTTEESIVIIDSVMERYPTTDEERTAWRGLRAKLRQLEAIVSLILRERPNSVNPKGE